MWWTRRPIAFVAPAARGAEARRRVDARRAAFGRRVTVRLGRATRVRRTRAGRARRRRDPLERRAAFLRAMVRTSYGSRSMGGTLAWRKDALARTRTQAP